MDAHTTVTPPPRTADEPFWPIGIGLLILTGMLSGWILSTLELDTADWRASGWVWLAATFVGIGLLTSVIFLIGRRTPRRYQIAAVFSLLAHTGALIVMAVTKIPNPRFDQPDAKSLPVAPVASTRNPAAEAEKPRAQIFFNMESSRAESGTVDLTTQAPLATGLPETAAPETTPTREQASLQPQAAKPEPTQLALNAPPPSVDPAKIARSANESTAVVRRGETLAKLSRNIPTQPQPLNSAAEAPNLTPKKTAEPKAPDASAQEIKRQVGESLAARRASSASGANVEAPQVASLTRRADTPRVDTTSAPLPTLPKKVNTPGQLPHTDTVAETAGKIAATPGATLQPGGVQVGRQTTSPFVAKPIPDLPLAVSEPGRAGVMPGPGVVARADTGSGGPLRAATSTTPIARTGRAGAGGTGQGTPLDAGAALPSVNATSGTGSATGGGLQPNAKEIGRIAGSGTGAGSGGGNGPGTGGGSPDGSALALAMTPKGPARSSGGGGPSSGAGSGAAGVRRNASGKVANVGMLLEAANEGALADSGTGTAAGSANPGVLNTNSGAVGRMAKSGPPAPGAGNGNTLTGDGDASAALLAANSTARAGTGSRPASGGRSVTVVPTLGGGGAGAGKIGRAGHAVGPAADLLADAGMPDGNRNSGVGGDGNLPGPGALQPGAAALARGTGGVPDGKAGFGPGVGDGSGGPAGSSSNVSAVVARADLGAGTGDGGPAVGGSAGVTSRIGRNAGNGRGTSVVGGSGAETGAEELQAPSPVAGTGTGEVGGLVAVKGGETSRQAATGIPGDNLAIPVGAGEGLIVADSVATAEPGRGVGGRKSNNAVGDGPQLGPLAGTTPRRQGSGSGNLPSGIGETVELPEAAGSPDGLPGGVGAAGNGAGGGGPSGLTAGHGAITRRNTGGGISVPVTGVAGEGGLGTEPSVNVGLPQPAAKPDAVVVGVDPSRYNLTKKSTGPLALDTRVRDAATGFAGRIDAPSTGGSVGPNRTGGRAGLPGEAETRTETAVELGLKFLVRTQASDGRWSLHNYPGVTPADAGQVHSDTAATGLALIAFLGAGYDHFDGEYRQAIHKGLQFLLKHQQRDGNFYLDQFQKSANLKSDPALFYSHAIATIALCEALGMTGDEELRGPAQKAVDYIVQTQNKDQGGWRYQPQSQSDMSVTGWVVTALKSGKLANLKVPDECFARVKNWLDKSQAAADPSQYVYNPFASDNDETREGRRASSTMTAVGLLMRLYTGWDRSNPFLVTGAQRLGKNLPDLSSYADQKSLGTYYWYYATQVMYHMGGEHWQRWNDKLHPLLVNTQVRGGPLAGSWDPRGGTADYWAKFGGRLYVTTLNLLSLEVTYRHLPLYEATGK